MSFWAGRVALVTGANGLTGSHLCRELLKEGARVRGFIKPTSRQENLSDLREHLELALGDVTDLDSLQKALRGVDFVFHPAAMVPIVEALGVPDQTVRVNVIGTYHVAFAAMKAGVKKMLHISTCHVYGDQPEYPVRETAIPHPIGIYAASKYAGEVLLRSMVPQGFPIVFSRAFAKFGPGQSTKFLIPNIIAQLLKEGEVRLGDPRPTRDYTYVVDIVRGYIQMLEKGRPGEIYHLSSGVERSVAKLYEQISGLMGVHRAAIWNQNARPVDTMRQVGDSTKAKVEFGWAPETPFREGLKQTIAWWRQRLEKEVFA